MRMFAPFASGIGKGEPGGRKDVELEELKRQLSDMQSQLAKIVKEN
jgi:polyhydroxyalkanoate synthesis regulator protein